MTALGLVNCHSLLSPSIRRMLELGKLGKLGETYRWSSPSSSLIDTNGLSPMPMPHQEPRLDAQLPFWFYRKPSPTSSYHGTDCDNSEGPHILPSKNNDSTHLNRSMAQIVDRGDTAYRPALRGPTTLLAAQALVRTSILYRLIITLGQLTARYMSCRFSPGGEVHH